MAGAGAAAAGFLKTRGFRVRAAERPRSVEVVDCSLIYDDLLRQVRVWARLGHSASEIQEELDARFQPISDVLDASLDVD